ncbi:MAG: EscU/YscU/HrcU family type III secretion system export apparatus switch protein [Actinomycetota bacterium]
MSGERSEKPTQKRLRDARREGRAVARTPELGAWLSLLGAVLLVRLTVHDAGLRAQEMLVRVVAVVGRPEVGPALRLLRDAGLAAAWAAAPLALGLMVLGFAAAVAQGGLRPAPKLLLPKFSRLNPFTGLRRMLGPQGVWEAAKSVGKSVVVGVLVWRAVGQLLPLLTGSGALPLSAVVLTTADAATGLVRDTAVAGLVMAGADYAVTRRRVLKGLRMTHQEVKEEHRQAEGDPLLRGALRSRQMAMARRRMMADVPRADVVVVNPTHVAVALRYEPQRGAPRVVAKGAGVIAAKIRERASAARVPMVEDVPLARALHSSCEVGQEIPPQFYAAVARVLAFVLSLKARGTAAGVHRPPAA